MNEINLEQFEMTNESMDKVLGGLNPVATGGHMFDWGHQYVWCESDIGDSDTNSIYGGYICHGLSKDPNVPL